MQHPNIERSKSEPVLIFKQDIELRAVTRKGRRIRVNLGDSRLNSCDLSANPNQTTKMPPEVVSTTQVICVYVSL